MAAGDAAAMMRGVQAGRPRRGGSVSWSKSAYRGIGHRWSVIKTHREKVVVTC
ncbi:hypothetical protein ROD_29422 [Citrobacter rodentium ICC168]|uniref:Uncharacterized protein n=1 Tax=Citrobacter rodentium (strain ICC168) TaxID=637910 RepID=D2TJP1_CITRI|nr:hypothetical protein ROD_29422 [Citrobacter rodentium ICC168]